MPVIEILVSERVAYKREVEVSEAEYRAMETKLDTLKGREYDRAVEEIAEKYIRRDDRDFFDADNLELDDLKVVV
jgi:hypothetical protein